MTLRLSSSGLCAGFALAALSAAPALYAAAPAGTNTAADTPVAASIFSPYTAIPDPTRDVRYASDEVSSSTDATTSPSLDNERESLEFDSGAGQPSPGRRRYGRSRYQDRLHNADGSSKIAFVAGAGINIPAGNTGRYYTPHFALDVGAGLNFNKTFGVLAEFSYQRMGLTGGAINYDYANTLNALVASGDTTATSDLSGFDANAHIFGFSVNPIVNLVGQKRIGAYATGGVGYYHKTTNFTLPQLAETYFGTVYSVNTTFDSYGAGGFGANGGVGLTYKLSNFSSERLFLEARYQWVNLGKNNSDFFPFNRLNTEVIPVTLGIRF